MYLNEINETQKELKISLTIHVIDLNISPQISEFMRCQKNI
jgi:hypothetical protein